MTMRSWIRKLFVRPLPKKPRRARLAVEALEQRCVPTFTVTNLLDHGSVGSLRWAVGQANMIGGDETIDFDPKVFATPQTITLTGTQLELTDTTGTETITGPAAGVTVDGGGVSRVFQVDGMVTASISGLTISGGNVGSGNGGGLANFGGRLTLNDCTVSGNSARSAGGIENFGGTVTLTDCTVSRNSAYGASGINNRTGTLTLTHCTVSGNSARGPKGDCGGIENFRGTVTLTDCTVSRNSAGVYGLGGGIDNFGGTLTLTDCTVSYNGANFGGGIQNNGTLTLTNCTVSANNANIGGGLEDGQGGTTTLSNTIVADNYLENIVGNVNANSSYNLIGPRGSGGLIDGVNHNQVGVANPGLGTLGDHGGPTQTIDLLGGSPALNAGDPAQLGVADQRGVIRAGGVNIGAYQASASAFVVTVSGTVGSGTPFDVTVQAVDVFGQVAFGYRGTVTFSVTDPDPAVVMPADYAFTADDQGTHRFTGEFTLITPGTWTLTTADLANGLSQDVMVTVYT